MKGEVSDASVRFGRTVRAIRCKLHRTQTGMACDARLSRTYIGELERGQRTPSLLTIVRISAALQMKAADLVDRARI